MSRSVAKRRFYRYPRKYRYLNAWALDFWDVMYYLAEIGEGEFTVTAREVARLMAGCEDARRLEVARQAFVRHRRQAVAEGELLDLTPEEGLVEEVPLDPRDGPSQITHRVGPKAFYRLAVPGWEDLRRGVILKPTAYVELGWPAVLETAMARRLLNFFLSRPWRGRDDPARAATDGRSAEAWLAEFTARHRSATGKTPSRKGVRRALDLLRDYRLLVETPGGLAFDPERLLWPPGWADEDTLLAFQAEDPLRAERAVELLRLARLPWRDLSRVFRDLPRFAGEEAYRVLREKAYGWREEPNVPAKWSRIVRSARAALREMEGGRLRRLSSGPLVADFALGEAHRVPVRFSEDPGCLQVVSMNLAVHLVARDWALRAAMTRGPEERRVEVWLEDRWGEVVPGSAWARRVRSDLGEGWWGADLAAAAARLPSLTGLTFVARCERIAPWCKVTARVVLKVR